MDEVPQQSRWALVTPLQRLVGVLVCVVAAGLMLAFYRVPPRADAIKHWIPPGAGWIGARNSGSNCFSVSLSVNQPFTNVVGWYREMLHLPWRGTTAQFTYYSG